MKDQPIRTTVIGSYPFPGWLEFSSRNLDQFGAADISEMQDDAVMANAHSTLCTTKRVTVTWKTRRSIPQKKAKLSGVMMLSECVVLLWMGKLHLSTMIAELE